MHSVILHYQQVRIIHLQKVIVYGSTELHNLKFTKKMPAPPGLYREHKGDNHVSPTTIQSSILHDQVSVLEEAEAYDPFKGVIPGLADKEIDYKTINDPAIYTNSTDSTAQINQQQAWGSNYFR